MASIFPMSIILDEVNVVASTVSSIVNIRTYHDFKSKSYHIEIEHECGYKHELSNCDIRILLEDLNSYVSLI